MKAVAFADTHVGQRPNNEDWYRIAPELGLFIVADGMGGYSGGELASRIAVGALDWFYRDQDHNTDEIPISSLMGEAFRLANVEVRRQRQGYFSKMGSTLTALVLQGDHALIGHVGDSRVYRLRDGQLEQLTCDHSLMAAMRTAGVSNMMIASKFGHIVTRAIGVTEDSEPDIILEQVEGGDCFLLCTDGLTDAVDDETIEHIVNELPPSEAATALIEEALLRGGEDNITALIVEVKPTAHQHHSETRMSV